MMNIAVAQSGGPTCAINASLVGVFGEALRTEEIDAIFGSINGIEGIINDNLIDLKRIICTNEDMELLKQTPSTVLGSCRFKLPSDEDNPELYQKILYCFQKHNIRCFFYIGGNDSMDTVAKLSAYFKKNNVDIRVIGVPKTIDNDLYLTDHTPGFGSAAKYVATTVQEIVRDSSVYSIDSVTIVEIMGRHAGWLTASTCVLRANGEIAPHLIYLPETEFSLQKFLTDVRKARAKYQAVVIAVSEGMSVSPEELGMSAGEARTDVFGHTYLGGIGKCLEEVVRREFKCKVRSIELNVMQRCSSHISSKTDIDESELIGQKAVKTALKGESGKMMCFIRLSSMPYTITITSVDASEVANQERYFPTKWINDEQNNVADDAIQYFLPLIRGEQIIQMENGLPKHFRLPRNH